MGNCPGQPPRGDGEVSGRWPHKPLRVAGGSQSIRGRQCAVAGLFLCSEAEGLLGPPAWSCFLYWSSCQRSGPHWGHIRVSPAGMPHFLSDLIPSAEGAYCWVWPVESFGYDFQLNPWSHCQLCRAGITQHTCGSANATHTHVITYICIFLEHEHFGSQRILHGKGLSSKLNGLYSRARALPDSKKVVQSSHRHVQPCWHELTSIHLPRLQLRCVPRSPRTVAHHLPIDRSLALVHSDQNCSHLLESAAVDWHHSCFVWDLLVCS